MDQSYTRFVHLIDANGQLVAQSDALPHGDYPTNIWDAGEQVQEQVTIPIPATLAPGQYTLQVGWYAQPSLERLRTSSDDKIILGTIEIR